MDCSNVRNSTPYGFEFMFFELMLFFDMLQTTSKRLADRKVERFQKIITKRGAVPETTTKKGNDYPVGPILLGFFVFVVIGFFTLYNKDYRCHFDRRYWSIKGLGEKRNQGKCCYID
ncbi:hypothetical protein GIB67_014988 [Kingdonia uniflora]|uniref:Uncharacterized protein n=1 Tax=Kingdonia uniflora TaxID=39325 RepID=A0A7J7MTM8_9MAGN|nr:hypothetical protein GIB67_014988 [Kingdonia uniflora]